MKFSFKKNPLLILGLAIFTFVGVVGCSSNELSDKIAQNEEKIAQVTNTVTTLQGSLTALQTTVTEVTSELEELTELQNAVTSLQADLTALEETVSALSGLDGSIGELQAKVNALETKATTLETKAAALEESYQTLNTTKAEKAAVAELSSAVEALSTTVSGLSTNSATKAELEAAIAAAAAGLNGAVAELNGALEALDTALDTRLDAVEGRIAALEESVAGLVTTVAGLSTAIEGLASQEDVTALQQATADLPALRTQIQLATTGLAALRSIIENEDTGLAARIEALESAVASMGGELQIRYVKEDDYKAATRLLAGTYELSEAELAEWNALVDEIEEIFGELDFTEIDTPYSLNAWVVIREGFDSDYYTAAQAAEYEVVEARNYFFLGRALSVEEVKGCFTSFKTYIAGLPTLEESFHSAVSAVEYITVDTIADNSVAHRQWQELVAVYTLASAAGYETETFLADEHKYELLSEAYENLVNAKAAFAALKTTVEGRNTTSEELGSKALLQYKADYAADKETLAARNEEFFPAHPVDNPETDDVDESALVYFQDFYPEGYDGSVFIADTITTINARVAYITLLEAAAVDFVKDIDEEAEGTQYIYGVLPSFNVTAEEFFYNGASFKKIEADYDAVLAWATAQGVDAENLAYIYQQATEHTLSDAKAANTYAETLETIYQQYVVATELKAKIQPYELTNNSTEFYKAVDYADKELLLSYGALFTNLNKAVKDYVEGIADNPETEEVDPVAGFPGGIPAVTAGDYAGMLAKATVNETHYDNVVTRLENLGLAETAIAAQLARIEDYKDEVTGKYVLSFANWDALFNTAAATSGPNSVRYSLNAIYASYHIDKYDVTGTTGLIVNGNAAMNKAVEEAYADVVVAYDAMAQEVREAVLAVKALLTEAVRAYPLEFAAEIEDVNFQIGSLITEYGLSNSEVKMSAGATESVDFEQLQDDIEGVLTDAAAKAALAQEAYNNEAEYLVALRALLPEWHNSTYYSKTGDEYSLIATGPLSDWETNYGDYFTRSGSGTEEDPYVYTPVQLSVKLDDRDTILNAYDRSAVPTHLGLLPWSVSVFSEAKILPTISEEPTAEELLAYNEELVANILTYVAKVQDTLGGAEPHYVINAVEYHFYTNEDAKLITDFVLAYLPLGQASAEAWDTLEATLLPLIAKASALPSPTYTIHDRAAYTLAAEQVALYKATYYRNYATATKVNNEAETIADFAAAYAAFNAFYNAAEEEFESVVGAINAALNGGSALVLTTENFEAMHREVLGYNHAPTWQSGTYYSRSGTSPDYVYTLTTSQPANWETNYADYFTRSGEEPSYVYTPVQSEHYTGLLEKVEYAEGRITTFNANFDSTATNAWFIDGHGIGNLGANSIFKLTQAKNMASAINVACGAAFNHVHHPVLTEEPEDWEGHYSWYYKVEDNALVHVEGVQAAPEWEEDTYYSRSGAGTELSPYVFTLTEEKPADWATNYANYFTCPEVADYAHVIELVEWAANTFYAYDGENYVLTTTAPADWATNYYYYYTYVPAVYAAVASETVAPEWQADTYYAHWTLPGVDRETLVTIYNQYIRSYSYNQATTVEQLNQYYGVYTSRVEALIAALPQYPYGI